MKSNTILAVLLALILSRSGFAIELSQDFDSGSLDVAGSTIDGTTVNLLGRKTWTQPPYHYSYRWVYFKASGVEGVRPRFVISNSYFLGDLRGHRYVYSYDRVDWDFFDNGSAGSYDYRFSNNAPFTEDEVYIAYSLPYPLSRTVRHMGLAAVSPYVSPTPSGGGDFVLGQSAGGVDDTGRSIPPHDLYAFMISDPAAAAEKLKVLLVGGNHSCETMGNHGLEGMIDFLLSDDQQAADLRRVAEFYVYPQVNPDGRFAGYYRSNPENPEKDFNRYWNNPAGFTDMTTVRNAMLADAGGDVDYLFDFHGMFGPWTRPNYFAVVPDDVGSPFALALAELEPDILEVASRGHAGMLRNWGLSDAGLKAEHAYTAEFGAHPYAYEDRLAEMGANYARALHQAVVGVPEPGVLVYFLIAAVVLITGTLRKGRHL